MRDGFENVLTTSSRVCSRGLGRSAALQILAIATAMAAVCALPGADIGRFVIQRTFNSGH